MTGQQCNFGTASRLTETEGAEPPNKFVLHNHHIFYLFPQISALIK